MPRDPAITRLGRILDGRVIRCPDETVGGMIRSLGPVVLLLVAALLIVQFTADFLEATGTEAHRGDTGAPVSQMPAGRRP